MATEELEQVGDGICNDYLLRPVKELPGGDLPAGGFVGKLAKDARVGLLKEELGKKLGVPVEGLNFAVEGRDLDDAKTIGENGVLEPGPAARKAGARIVITFLLSEGVELGSVVAKRKADQEAEERAEAERQAREQAALEAAREQQAAREKAEAAAKQKKEADALAEMQERQRNLAREADQCTVRCFPLGMSEGQDVRTYRSVTVAELARTVSEQMGMRGTAGTLTLTFQGEVLASRTTLREAGIGEGAEVYYYWEGGD